jgi:hypothetical protein
VRGKETFGCQCVSKSQERSGIAQLSPLPRETKTTTTTGARTMHPPQKAAHAYIKSFYLCLSNRAHFRLLRLIVDFVRHVFHFPESDFIERRFAVVVGDHSRTHLLLLTARVFFILLTNDDTKKTRKSLSLFREANVRVVAVVSFSLYALFALSRDSVCIIYI